MGLISVFYLPPGRRILWAIYERDCDTADFGATEMTIHYERDECGQLGKESSAQTKREFLVPFAKRLDHLERYYK